jgi:hypothetical protein
MAKLDKNMYAGKTTADIPADTTAANTTAFIQKELSRQTLSAIHSNWKGAGDVTAAFTAAFQIGVHIAGNMIGWDEAKLAVERGLVVRLIDEKHWPSVIDALQLGRASLVSHADLMARLQPAVANDNNAVSYKPTPFVPMDPSTIPLRDWIYGRLLIRGNVAMTIAAGAVGKTSLKIVEALALATGRSLLGIEVPRRARVWLFNLEDDLFELQRRVGAAMIHYNIKPEDIAGWLYIDGDKPLFVTKTDFNGTKILLPIVDELVKHIRDLEIDAMTLDPFVSTHDAPENDNGAMDRIMKQAWKPVARDGGCSVNLCHHTTKVDAGTATAMSGRGGGSIVFAGRSAQVLNLMSWEEAKKAGLESPAGYFSEINDKENMSPATGIKTWYFMKGVSLGNGPKGNLKKQNSDSVGVVTRWEYPTDASLTEGVTDEQLQAILNLLKVGIHRKNIQATDWAGYVVGKVLGLGASKETIEDNDKRRIKLMLDAWIKQGVLDEYADKDKSGRHDRPCLRTASD